MIIYKENVVGLNRVNNNGRVSRDVRGVVVQSRVHCHPEGCAR